VIKVRNQQLINTLGIRVKALRIQRGLSMEKLAELSEIDYRQVFNIEHGRTNATVSTLDALCKGLDISLSELFDTSTLK